MAKEIVIDCNTNGSVQAMHFDEFPIIHLGDAKVERASEIFFDAMDKSWSILLPHQHDPIAAATGFKGYDEARGFEVEWLQACRKDQVAPTSREGIEIAERLKEVHLQTFA